MHIRTICIIRQMQQQGHIRFSVEQIQPLKWGRERNISETKTEVFLNCCCFTYYIFLVFYVRNVQIYHNSTGVSHMPHYSVKVKNVLFCSQSWLLSVFLGGPLEGFCLPVFCPSCSLTKQLFVIMNFSGCGQICFGLVHRQAQMFKCVLWCSFQLWPSAGVHLPPAPVLSPLS